MLIYRDDVKEFGFEQKKDYVLSEPQFEQIERFIEEQVRVKRLEATGDMSEVADLIITDEFVTRLRERLGITREIHNLLFGSEQER